MRRESTCSPVTVSAQGRVTSLPERLDDVQLDRDHASKLPRHDAVVERDAPVGELHLRVGALPGDHDDVAGLRVGERRGDRLAPVER